MRQHRSDPAAIEAEIAHLRSFAIDALRRRWRVIFGRSAPAALSKDLLGRMIAWRLQEQAFGGLDRESLKFLDRLARHSDSPRRRLKPGTVLVRDYQGQRHTVTVARDGFDWQGTIYPSLSRGGRDLSLCISNQIGRCRTRRNRAEPRGVYQPPCTTTQTGVPTISGVPTTFGSPLAGRALGTEATRCP